MTARATTRNFRVVHIIAQAAWRDPAFIIGTADALKLLRNAIDAALNDRDGGRAHVFAEDGESYVIAVKCLDVTAMQSIPQGYTNQFARDNMPWPEWMVAVQ